MKFHESKGGNILALCDEELLGKKYKEGEMVIDLEKYGSFYNGQSVSENSDHLENIAKGATSINAVGERSIVALGKMGFETGNSRKIEGVPHLQIFLIR